MSKHEMRSDIYEPASNVKDALGNWVYTPGSLDKMLNALRDSGIKVLDFWLEQGFWHFKTMASR